MTDHPGYPQRIFPNTQGEGANLLWTQLTWAQNPTQWHIIKALAGLPAIDLPPAFLVKGIAILYANQSRVLE
jgi:acetoacetate decarboxylase